MVQRQDLPLRLLLLRRALSSGTDNALVSLLQTSQRLTCIQVTQHGACLGLGLAALGSADEEVTEEVKNVLYTDSAVAGEAAGIALGLVNVGTASEKTQELLTYAHDTQHEKVSCSRAMTGHAWLQWGLLCRLVQLGLTVR